MQSIKTTYTREDTVEFLIDDDRAMRWLGNFESSNSDRLFLVIDKHIEKLWGTPIREQLKKHGKVIHVLTVPVSESTKSLAYYPKLVSFLEKNKCGLKDLVIAAGGGVVIDLVSFTCSTYMRGLPFIVISTNLVAMVDASTAGKTCLDTPSTKNLLGTFYYPKIVYNNVHFLSTNSPYFERQGLSEIYKYGLLDSEQLIAALVDFQKSHAMPALKRMIKLGIETRIRIRKRHPQASNLGHTFGHAIEKMSGYQILHGDAISAGTVLALHFAQREGLTSKTIVDRVIHQMKEEGLNIWVPKNLNVKKMVGIMLSDKKSSSKLIQLVLLCDFFTPYKTATSYFYPVAPQKMEKFLKDFLKSYPYTAQDAISKIAKDYITY